jgi:hypothetical protein
MLRIDTHHDYSALLITSQPDRFGFFATIPLPHIERSVAEAVRALDELRADGVVLLANYWWSVRIPCVRYSCQRLPPPRTLSSDEQ